MKTMNELTLEALAEMLPPQSTGASRVRPLTDVEHYAEDNAPEALALFGVDACHCPACERVRAVRG